ncbi:CCHC-type domain-containing protein [Trichonephila clavipes]|nr:CCHC-type domain-containing protein [Trichonephila clavipes]
MKRKENFQLLPKELHQLKYEAISVPQGSVRLVKKTQERKSSTCYLLIPKCVTSSRPVPLKTRRVWERLVSLIRTIVREEVHRLVNQTQESLDSDPQSLEQIVQDEVERVLAPVSTKPTETRPRPTYAAVTRKYRAPVQKFPPEPRKTDVWRTADNRPVCFHCGRLEM